MRPLLRIAHSAVATLGPLRTVLALTVVLSIVSAGFAGGEVVYTFPGIVPTLLAAPVAVMLVFVLALDLLMTWVFLTEAVEADRRRLRQVIVAEGLGLALLVVVWVPHFVRLVVGG